MKIGKDELRMVARSKGWSGGRASKDDILNWFRSAKNLNELQVWELVRTFRAAARGTSTVAPTGSPGLGRQEVIAIVNDAIRTMGLENNEELVRKLVAENISKAMPGRVVIDSTSHAKIVLKDRVHPLFDKVLKLVASGVNVLLVGPAGCGKTTLAHMVAKALKRKFGMLSCTSGASEAQLTGWLLPIGKGSTFSYVASEFVRLYEEGNAVFLFDEFDAADPNMLLVINSALANGSLHVPQRHEEPLVERGEKMAMIAAANTYGSGADMIYAGRNQLDAATLDRFYVIEMDYDVGLEAQIGDKEVVKWAHELRRKVSAHRVRRVVSTRTIMKMTAAVNAGFSFDEAKKDVLAGWTKDELSKVGQF